ncbi:MAG: alginate export family protein [Pseudomonadota bacterium]|nr:alginate export family protein [Pseudomonadota bacterium]
MPYPKTLLAMCALALYSAALPLHAERPGVASVEWDVRMRYEGVQDDAFAHPADAATARARLGLRLTLASGWTGLLEGEAIAGNQRYNSGANGRTAFPAVIDPRGVELNQAWLGWRGTRAAATLGRQRLLFDNQRWIGNVGWRQNEQTFDSAAFEFAPRKHLSLRYAFLDRVHRVNGDDALDPRNRERALSSHLFNAAWKYGKQQLSGYCYLHEDRDIAIASSATWGLRWAGSRPLPAVTLGWTLEAARQRDHANNPQRFSHTYWLVEPNIAARGITARAGWEHLGGNGAHALQTPLATLHAFNGWADKFLVTPSAGLEDRYLGLGGSVGRERAGARPAWQVAWHDYHADRGGARYGREWNASLSLPLAKGLSGLLKIADYRAAGVARDTRKLWLQVDYRGIR